MNQVNFIRLMTDRFMRDFIEEYRTTEWIMTGIVLSEDEVRKKFGVKPALTLKEMSELSAGESD